MKELSPMEAAEMMDQGKGRGRREERKFWTAPMPGGALVAAFVLVGGVACIAGLCVQWRAAVAQREAENQRYIDMTGRLAEASAKVGQENLFLVQEYNVLAASPLRNAAQQGRMNKLAATLKDRGIDVVAVWEKPPDVTHEERVRLVKEYNRLVSLSEQNAWQQERMNKLAVILKERGIEVAATWAGVANVTRENRALVKEYIRLASLSEQNTAQQEHMTALVPVLKSARIDVAAAWARIAKMTPDDRALMEEYNRLAPLSEENAARQERMKALAATLKQCGIDVEAARTGGATSFGDR